MDLTAADQTFVLQFELCCTATGVEESKRVQFTSMPGNVGDIKAYIQDHFSIPKCLQSISLKGHTLHSANTLPDLYFRSEDCLSVSYLHEADVKGISGFIHLTLCPIAHRLAANQPLTVVELRTLLCSSSVSFSDMTHDKFLPWDNALSRANRELFVQEGGLERCLEINSQLLKKPFHERSKEFQNLERHIISLLWNFCETYTDRSRVIRMGGLALAVKSLTHFSVDSLRTGQPVQYVFHQAAGFITTLSEVESCQIVLASNDDVMQQLLTFSNFHLSFGNFTHVMTANFLFCLSHSFKTHHHLAHRRNLAPMLTFYHRFATQNVTIGLLLSLVFARLLLFSPDLVAAEYQQEIVNSVNFASKATVEEITALEEHYQNNWVTVVPFLEMLYAPLFDKAVPPVSLTPKETLLHSCQLWSIRVALIALRAEFERVLLRKLAVKQGLLDYIVCLPWGMHVRWWDDCFAVMQLFQRDRRLPVPCLSSIAKAALARSGGCIGLRGL